MWKMSNKLAQLLLKNHQKHLLMWQVSAKNKIKKKNQGVQTKELAVWQQS